MKNILMVLLYSVSFFLVGQTTDELNNSSNWSKHVEGSIEYYTKKDLGKIPVLCFHKIGTESRYELTATNFENFLIYLNDNKFYPLSDKELINRDFSKVPTGYTPIVLGSDDASEGNFEYKTSTGDRIHGPIDLETGKPELLKDTMVYLLEKHLSKVNEKINFTFYISFDGLPFRQSGGQESTDKYYRGLDVVGTKINYLLDNFIVGIHTVTHRVTKDITVEDFEWELNEFFDIMNEYVGSRVNEINTLAYPYGCADLDPKLREMIVGFRYGSGSLVIGAFDFDGYFSRSSFDSRFDNMEVSRLGVDNQNIERVYGFLESVPLFNTKRVIVVKNKEALNGVNYNDEDTIIINEGL